MLYFSHRNAWSDTRVFGQWWEEFLKAVRKLTHQKLVVLIDYHSSHADLVDPRGEVRVMEYPPNCTSKHQAMDQDIIQSLRMHYRSTLLTMRADIIPSVTLLRQQAARKKMPPATRGQTEGYPPHVLDAAELGHAVWEKVTPESTSTFQLHLRHAPPFPLSSHALLFVCFGAPLLPQHFFNAQCDCICS